MVKLLYSLILLSSIVFSNHTYSKCGFATTRADCGRPATDTYYVSQTGHFWIHYDNPDSDHAPPQSNSNSNNIPDFVEEVAIAAENSRNIIIDQWGYIQEVDDEDGIYDIYLQNLGIRDYGINCPDEDNGLGTYVIIDNDFPSDEYFTSGLDAMRITVAHEFFHAIQQAYRPQPISNNNIFIYEMSSMWMEDIIYPDVNDYIDHNWTDDFFNNPDLNIDTYPHKGYCFGLYLHYLVNVIEANPIDEQSTIIREIWEEHETNSVAWSSINDILNNNYSTNFSESWVGFCSRNLFNGLYLDMNNDFYYHEDQLDAEPIIFNEISNLDENINDFILGKKKVRFLAYEPSFNMFINISDIESVPSGANIIGNFVLESDNLDNQEIIDIYDFEFLQITDIDKIYLILGVSNVENALINFDLGINFEYEYGDINQNNIINVVDIIAVVNYIFNLGDLDAFQLMLADMNFDNEVNVQDILLIVDYIINF